MKLLKQTDEFPFVNEGMGDYIYNRIIKDVNDLKSQIIDSVAQNKHTTIKKPQVFLNKVNDFIKFWHNYGQRAAEAIDSNGVLAKPTENLKYSYVRKFMFGNFDFKSVLLYIDGMVKHISDEKKKYTQEDLEEFYKFTIKDAFGTDSVDISSLLTDFEVSGDMNVPDEDDTDFDPNMIKGFEIFKDSDYTDLYKSIEGVIDFISFDRMKNLFMLKKQIKNNLLASFAVKSIFDYIIFSLVFYAIRVYTVSRFLNSFVNNEPEKNDQFSESVITPADTLESFLQKMVIFKLDIDSAYWYDDAIFASMDELIARDTDKSTFFKMFKMFTDMHGISNLKTETMPRKAFFSEFDKPFKESKLFNFFMQNDFKNPAFKPNLTELYLQLKYLLHVPNQALATSNNPVHNHRARFLDNFIQMSCGGKDSLLELKHSAVMVYHFTKFMFEEILDPALAWINNCHCKEIKPSDFTTDRKIFSVLNNYMAQFYDEFSLIALKVMQYIENKIYYCEKGDQHADKTSKPSPGYVRTVTKFDQVFIDGQQTFNESFINVWSYPYYENMKIYNDYLKSYPEFRQLSYFSEGTNEWWDKIVAWFKGIGDKIAAFFTNAKVKNCIEWVSNNQSNIKAAEFKEDTEVEWYKYKKVVEIKDLNATIDGLTKPGNDTFNENGEFKQENADAWEKDRWKEFFNVHENDVPKFKRDDIISLAKEHSSALKAAIINKIFFNSTDATIPKVEIGDNIAESGFEQRLSEQQKVKVKGELLKKCIEIAMDNLSKNTFESISKLLKESSDKLKEKINEAKKAAMKESVDMYLSEANGTPEKEEEKSSATDELNKATKETNTESDPTKAQENTEKQSKDNDKIAPHLQNTYNRILINYVVPVQIYFPKFLLNQYNFIKAAYDARSNKESK